MNAPNKAFLGTTCKQCGAGTYIETDGANEWWVKCDDCSHLLFCYQPMPHQLRFHRDPTKFKLYAGGYGSAKTSTCGAEFITYALSTPNGRGLVGAQTYPQLDQTAKKQILEMIPQELIIKYNQQQNIITLKNGYEILFRSFDEEQKLRSLNLSHVWIEEANGTTFDIFTQLQTRLRHHATDKHRIIMSTNPDGNWIKTEVLLKAGKIHGSSVKYPQKISDINQNISVHIAKTEANTFLPPTYVQDVSVGKPDWWVRRYLEGSFENAEGAVYPNFEKAVEHNLTYQDIVHNIRTKGWKVIGGADFGLIDPTVLLLAAIDPEEGIVYVYDEYYRNRVAVPSHAREMLQRLHHIPYGSLSKLVGDPSGKRRNITDKTSIFSHYAEYGIYFQEGNNRIEAGIQKVYSYLELGKLKVLSHLEHTIEEHINYMYKSVELGEQASEKPMDGNDHTCDSLRYLVNELPDDPNNLKTSTYGVSDYRYKDNSQKDLPFALQSDDDEGLGSKDDWYTYY